MAFTDDQSFSVLREMVEEDETLAALTKPDLKAAIVATDAWVTANAASFNAALPQPFKGAATADQKAQLLAVVALRRFRPNG